MTIPEIGVSDVPSDPTLLDVREADEWAAGHAPGAVHIPMTELAERLEEVPDGDPVHVICRSGGRSARVTQYLNANGWDAVNVAGGMLEWARSGRPVLTDDGSPAMVL